MSAVAVDSDSSFDITNKLARSLAEPSLLRRVWRQLEGDLDKTDLLLGELELLLRDAEVDTPRISSSSRVYRAIRELCERYDVGFRPVSCRRVAACLDTVYLVQEQILPRVTEARKWLKIYQKEEGGETS